MKTSTTTMFLTIFSIALMSAIPARANKECTDKVMASCTKCHYQTRICEKLGKKSQRDWKVTTKRMIRYGLILSDSEQESIVKCLLALGKDSGDLCK